MKSVLISIRPQWCELIASGRKTIEVRKTRPKLDPPFKCYVYCTRAKEHFVHGGVVESLDDLYRMPSGEIKYGYSGELMCCHEPYGKDNFLNKKVIGEFVCDNITTFNSYEIACGISETAFEELPRAACLSRQELLRYCGDKLVHAWHISDLVIYDKPKELPFKKKAAPQSWCYVEVLPKDVYPA